MLRIILTAAISGFFCVGFLLSAQELSTDDTSDVSNENEGAYSDGTTDQEIICQYIFNPQLELIHLFKEREEVENDCNTLEQISRKQPPSESAKMAFNDCKYYMKQIDNDIIYFRDLIAQDVRIDPACQEIIMMDGYVDDEEEEGQEEEEEGQGEGREEEGGEGETSQPSEEDA